MKPSQGWRAKMIKVTVSKEARKDLVNIHRYISEELENPQAANRIIHELRSADRTVIHKSRVCGIRVQLSTFFQPLQADFHLKLNKLLTDNPSGQAHNRDIFHHFSHLPALLFVKYWGHCITNSTIKQPFFLWPQPLIFKF